MRVVSKIAAPLFVLAAAAVAHAAPFAVEVTAGALNVRDSAWGRVLGQAAVGDRFVAQDSSNGWLRISWNGRGAWIAGQYTKRISASAAQVAVGQLNVRSGAGMGYGVMQVVAQGQLYVIRGGSGGWTLIQLDHRYGYVADSYVSHVALGNNGGSAVSQPVTPPPPSGGNPPQSASSAELEVMARIIKGEAGVTSYEGKVAVGAVILNRVQHPRFPSSIIGVCHQPYQFSCYNSNVRNQLYYGSIPAEAWQAARDALNGDDPTGNAQYYFNPYLVAPSWANTLVFTVRIGTRRIDTHDFYKIRGT